MPASPSRPDLFEAALAERLAARSPLAERCRPASLDDLVGQAQLLAPGAPLRVLIESDRLGSVILWGPPGTGKTTIARIIAETTRREFVALSAVTAGVRDVREVIDGARRRLAEHDRATILFLDEIHRFNKAQQDALLPAVEDGTLSLIGATTENPAFELNPPLLSRSSLFRLDPLQTEEVVEVLRRGLALERGTASEDALVLLAERSGGDARAALGALEVALGLSGGTRLVLEHAEAALSSAALRYGRDEHYDIASAFIKSIRGSDPDAGLYWLARMLAAGEDPRFIVRRLVILASEDVGMADPLGLVVAQAAAAALEVVGLPEAALNLAHAVVYLACAPKSNRVTVALRRAQGDVAERAAGVVPAHLRDASYPGATSLGHGVGYGYPHDDPRGWLEQEYRPPEVAGRRYYEPSRHGREAEIGERMRTLGQGLPEDER